MEKKRIKKIVPPLFVLMVIIFSIICIIFYRGGIEESLTNRAKETLSKTDIPMASNVIVKFSGRDAYLSGVIDNMSDEKRIYEAVDNVEGVKLVYTDFEVNKPVKVIEQQPIPEPQPIVEVDLAQSINTKKVYFDVDENFIKQDFHDELSEVGSLLSQHPDTRVKITGYADRRGTAKHNMELSKRRAIEVQKHLMDLGVNASQLEVDYKGEVMTNIRHFWKYYKYDRKVEFLLLNQVSH